MKDKKAKLIATAKTVWHVMSQNLGLKLLSVVFALMLWSYVITSNTDITRTKTHTGLQGYVTGQVALDSYDLALVSDPTEALSDITVDVEVPQVNYTYSRPDNIQVTLDLSSVRTAGVQEVPIKATTAYGKVSRIYPASLTLEFEPLDSRSIPVNVQLTGKAEDHWYNCSRVNPSQITITGATSLVQDINSLMVTVDVSGRSSSYSTSCAIELMDKEGNIIPNTLLSRSASSVSIGMEVYPTKELPISTTIDDVLVGQVAEGYIIEAITVQPRTITVAADKELLDSLNSLIIEPIEIDSPTQSFTRRASISGLSDFRYISSEQVYVNVQIAEETISDWVEDVGITFRGCGDGLEIAEGRGFVAVHVTGPRSQVDELSNENLSVLADLSGLGPGTYEIALTPEASINTAVTFSVEPATIQVTLTEAAAE